ncbi:hypothetical protein PSACC_02406 [Paramicrosporidium saccamoebae]|uniref:Uncharacterized protein n=1 Tax=Paramicrosporidium saccamoebae TaxID=1246581 RepID=A0A2H9TJ59_9FUNG|nr:hypothetical protein PSACC_02406 [Paramicrosporidium saccamoebae]
MEDVVNLEECFLDSPPYRQRLARCDTYLQEVEQCLRTVLKTARTVITGTEELSEHYNAFAECLTELGRLEANRPTRETYQPFDGDMASWTAGQHIMFLAEELKRIETARKSFALQLETVLVDPLDSLARTDLCVAREYRKRWERSGTEYLHENSKFMSRKSKDAGLAEGAAEVASLRRTYHEASLEYAARMGEVLGKEQLRISEAVLGLCQSRMLLCEKEHAVLDDIAPNLRLLEQFSATFRTRVNSLHDDYDIQRQTIMQKSVNRYNPLQADTTDGAGVVDKSGYLYKRSSHAMRPVWSRRFFSLHDNCLEYYTMEGKNNASTVLIDLRLCTVKRLELSDRRLCFEIVSPVKTYTLQAENEREMEEWIRAIQTSIREAIQGGVDSAATPNPPRSESPCQEMLSSYLPGTSIEASLDEQQRRRIRAVPGNGSCADCGMSDPEWASLSLGILVCIECSGIHRSLGVHKSKVRSLRLDYWEPEHIEIMTALGNERVQAIFETTYRESEVAFYRKPSATSAHEEKEQWIIAKYDLTKFIAPWTGGNVARAVQQGDLATCLHWLATGHDVNSLQDELTQSTALLLAIDASQWTVTALLLLWAASLTDCDIRQQSALHHLAHSTTLPLPLLVSILRRNPPLATPDIHGDDPLSIAVRHAHGDFVTILRMFQHDTRTVEDPGSGVKKPPLRRLLRGKFYRRLTPRRRRSLSSAMEELSPFGRKHWPHRRSHSHTDSLSGVGIGDGTNISRLKREDSSRDGIASSSRSGEDLSQSGENPSRSGEDPSHSGGDPSQDEEDSSQYEKDTILDPNQRPNQCPNQGPGRNTRPRDREPASE